MKITSKIKGWILITYTAIKKSMTMAFTILATWLFGMQLWDVYGLADLLKHLPLWCNLTITMIFIGIFAVVPVVKSIFKKPKKSRKPIDKIIQNIDQTTPMGGS